jgi:DNA replication and repair protein RecF
VGPHRDTIDLLVGGRNAASHASAGQARSILLALTLAALEVFRDDRGEAPVALLDDLDSELDEARVQEVCREVASRGQALVTTAHPGWARELRDVGRAFEVSGGRVAPA